MPFAVIIIDSHLKMESGNKILKEILDFYDNFELPDGFKDRLSVIMKPYVILLSKHGDEKGLLLEYKGHIVDEYIESPL
jgi:hypothetical protein